MQYQKLDFQCVQNYNLFLVKPKQNRKSVASAAAIAKPCCGRVVQLNICIGNTEKVSNKDSGTNGTYAMAPTTIKGAVSPIALGKYNIIPVKIPSKAEGSVTLKIVFHFGSP